MMNLRPHPCLLPVCVFIAQLLASPLAAEDWHWNTQGRVIALSDIHGAHDDFVRVLTGVNLIDASGHWSGGHDQLVIVGDVLDRGAGSRDVIEMLMRLETEAKQAGGRVHLLLGNHEIMNMVGDLRYIAVDEYARYVDVENPAHRQQALQAFMKSRTGAELDETQLQEKFNRTHPPGFFGHQEQFASAGILGSWLLQRPVAIKVNDSVFVHGGLSPAMKGRSLADINRAHHDVIKDYMLNREYLVRKGLLEASTNFYDQPATLNAALKQAAEGGSISSEDVDSAKRLVKAYQSDIFADSAPTWYRGNVGCSEAIEKERLRSVLAALGASRLVIGHTPTASRTIESRFDDLVIRVDTGMLKSSYQGQASAAIITAGKVTGYYLESDTRQVSHQARRVGPRAAGVTDLELEKVLVTAPVSNREVMEDGQIRLDLDYAGQTLDTIFIPTSKKTVENNPAVAAYRLDRHLGLEMVPVTVVRTLDENTGDASLNMESLVDEDVRVARQMGSSAWCPLKDQFNMMYAFDVLLHNKGRQRNAMRYTPGEMRLVLIDNQDTLGSQRGSPKYLKTVPISLAAEVKARLKAMDETMLEELLGDVLDKKRRKAILSRRDQLLKQSK